MLRIACQAMEACYHPARKWAPVNINLGNGSLLNNVPGNGGLWMSCQAIGACEYQAGCGRPVNRGPSKGGLEMTSACELLVLTASKARDPAWYWELPEAPADHQPPVTVQLQISYCPNSWRQLHYDTGLSQRVWYIYTRKGGV